MDLSETLKNLEASDEFSEWIKENPDNYLAHAFTIFDTEHVQEDWQIGYYNKNNDKITVFVLGEKITKNPETDAFKEEGKIIEEIKKENVKISVGDALQTVRELQDEKYSAHPLFKTIVILQNLKDFGTIWNVTLVTKTFKTINIKIDASTGKLKEDKIVSIIDKMGGGEKDGVQKGK